MGDTEKFFTAEYNFIPKEDQVLFFGEQGNQRYEIRLTETGVKLLKKTAQGEETIASATVNYPVDKLNTVRVENGDGIGYLYLNGMRVISYEAEAQAGALGYTCAEGVEYTAFSNEVFGTSDFEAIKNFPTKFPAVTYLKGENRGFHIAGAETVKGGVRVGEKQSISEAADGYAVRLEKNDWIKYAVDIPADDTYFIGATVTLESDAEIRITLGDCKLETKISAGQRAVNGNGQTVNVALGTITAKMGITTMKAEVLSGKVDFLLFEVEENAGSMETESVEEFQTVFGKAEKNAGRLTVTGSDIPAVTFYGTSGAPDFEATVSFMASGDLGADFGLMLRERNYSYFSAQPIQSWQGYYLQLSTQIMMLKRYDYGEEMLQAVRIDDAAIVDGSIHSLNIKAVSGRITVTLDDTYIIDVKDDYAFLTGRFGIYSVKGEIVVTDFFYKTLDEIK